jgi:hypothetical protein
LSFRLLSGNVKTKIRNPIILSVVLYECDTWSLTLRKNRIEAFEKRVLKKIFGPKRDDII